MNMKVVCVSTHCLVLYRYGVRSYCLELIQWPSSVVGRQVDMSFNGSSG